MRINNNYNQPSFEMNSVTAIGVTVEIEKVVDRLRPEILKIGHVAADCLITQGQTSKTIKATVIVGVPETPPIVGIAEDVFCEDKLLNLVHSANNALNQEFIDLRLPRNPTKADFDFSRKITFESNGDQIEELKTVVQKHLTPPESPEIPPKKTLFN